MNPSPQAELWEQIEGKGFLRRCESEDALFVTDANLRIPADQQSELERSIVQCGFRVWKNQHGLWAIDPDETRWRALAELWQLEPPCEMPQEAKLMDAYALSRLLAAHQFPWAAQPRELVRELLKRCDRPIELFGIAPRLLCDCAKRLRLHQSLPSSAAGLLFASIRKIGGGKNV